MSKRPSPSPPYPSIGLPTAVSRIRHLKDKSDRVLGTRLQAVKALGYGSENGSAVSTVNAMRQYGLLDVVEGKFHLTELALTILASSECSGAGWEEASTKPAAFKLIQDVGPGDLEGRRAEAVLAGKGFTRPAIAAILRAYSETFPEHTTEGVPSAQQMLAPAGDGDKSPLEKAQALRAQLIKQLEDVETFIRMLPKFQA